MKAGSVVSLAPSVAFVAAAAPVTCVILVSAAFGRTVAVVVVVVVLPLFFYVGDTVGGGVTSCLDCEVQEGKEEDVIIFFVSLCFLLRCGRSEVTCVIEWALKSSY